jgi:hypothetical protein
MSEPGISSKLLGCLIKPLSILPKIDEGDLWISFLIILLIASTASTARYNYAIKPPIEIPEFPQRPGQRIDPEAFKRNIAYFQAFGEAFGVISNWLLTALLIHLYTRPLGGRGSLKGMLAKAGFASMPRLIQQALRLVDAYTISRESLLELMASLQNSSTLSPFSRLNLFVLLTLIFLILAASANYGISKKRAAMSTLLAYLTLTLPPLLALAR